MSTANRKVGTRRAPVVPPNRFKGKPVAASRNTVAILRVLGQQTAPVGLTLIARELGLVPSTCFNILHTLVNEDFVVFDPGRKLYSIGYGVMDLARSPAIIGTDVNMIRPICERVAQDLDVTIALFRRVSADQMVLVLAAFGAGSMRVYMSVGQRPPLLAGAAGRVMAAYLALERKELRRLFRQISWDRSPSFEAYLQQVESARQRGWADDNGYMLTGTAAVSVPVFNRAGQFVMACSAAMLTSQYNDRNVKRVLAGLSDVSHRITQLSPAL